MFQAPLKFSMVIVLLYLSTSLVQGQISGKCNATSFYYYNDFYETISTRVTLDEDGEVEWSLEQAKAADEHNRANNFYDEPYEFESCLLYLEASEYYFNNSDSYVQVMYCVTENEAQTLQADDACFGVIFNYQFEVEFKDVNLEIY